MSRLPLPLVLCLLSACEAEEKPEITLPVSPSASARPRAETTHVSAAPSASERAPSEVVPALRCGECHEKMYEEWRTSRHRGANRSPLYRAMLEDAGSDACPRCHAPLTGLTAPESPAARDGVSCEVCHRIESAEVRRDGPGFSLRQQHDVKLGPLCDAKQPYFHRSECLPLFESAELCGSCHTWVRTTPAGAMVPVYTEYLDWQRGPSRSKPCQSCHMPGARASLASSEPERDDVPDHGFMGEGRALAAGGITVQAVVSAAAGPRLRIAARLRNGKTGHYVPAGMSGRQLVLRARALGDGGDSMGQQEVVFERRLVDDDGREAPFYRATRVGADTRLAPRERRAVTLELDPRGATALELALVRRRLSPALARKLGQSPEEQIVHRATLELGSAGSRLPGAPRSLRLPP